MTLRNFLRDVREHASSNLMELHCAGEQPSRWRVARERVGVTLQHVRYLIAAVYCDRFGHSSQTEVADNVYGERDARGRLVDIDCGSVSWFCPRCGRGGTNYF